MIYGWKEFYPVDFVRIGTLTIENIGISINGEVHAYESINNLVFLINDYGGKRLRTPGMLWDAVPSLSQGVDNRIEFEVGGEQLSMQIQIKSKEQFSFLGNRLKELYLLGVSFDERLNDGKSYGLEHLNYKEIQDFKGKYYK